MAKSDGSQSGGGFWGGVIGAVIGFVVGGPAGAFKGFMYGSTIGGLLIPPSGPDQVGPRLEDATIQTSSNFADIFRFDGTMGMVGNMIWAKENKLQEVVTTTTKKKKLLGFTVSKVKTTTYTYYLNAAYGFALMDEDDNCQLLKCWLGDKLMLNKTTDDMGTVLSSGDFEEYITFYKGTGTQAPDPMIRADTIAMTGLDTASGWPGLCYMVIHDLDMTPWFDSPERAPVKVELCSGEASESGLEFISQSAATIDAEYVELYAITHMDQEGLHAWKIKSPYVDPEANEGFGTADWETADRTFTKYHFLAIPGTSTFILKDTIEEIIPHKYLEKPQYETYWLRHAAKGKSDVNAGVFVTAFVEPGGGGSGGMGLTYPNPIWTTGEVVWSGGLPPLCNHSPIIYDSFYEAIQMHLTGIHNCPGTASSAQYVFDALNQNASADGIRWADASGGGAGLSRFIISLHNTNSSTRVRLPKMTEDSMSSESPFTVSFSVTVVMPGFNKEFKLPGIGTGLPSEAKSFFAIYKDQFYWGYNQSDNAVIYKVNTSGIGPEATASFSGQNIIRIGIIDDELQVISLLPATNAAQLDILPLDLSDRVTKTSADINTAFGMTDEFFTNNTSPDYDGFLYYREPNIYKKASFDATEELYGDASDNIITGAVQPEFFHIWEKGTLIGTSTYGGTLPDTGAQFWSHGLIGAPGTAQLADLLRKYSMLAGLPTEDINTSLINQVVNGHIVAKRGSVRNIMDQLRFCWPFDIIPSEYQIKFVPRGQEPVMNISHEDLEADVQLIQDREMSTVLPQRVTFRYKDRELEYENNEQNSTRPIDSKQQLTIEVPIDFRPDQAAQIADVAHSLYLVERSSYSGFVLPPTCNGLEPSDVITITYPEVIYELRLTNLKTNPNGSMLGEAEANDVHMYTSTAKGSTRPPPPQTIPVAGGAITVLMDLPVIEFENAPGIDVLMASVFENWTGGILWKESDDGVTWQEVQGFIGSGTGGTCRNTLGAHACHVPDMGGSLSVDMYVGQIATVSEIDFYNEQFLVAYGANGRWEIMACRFVTDNGGGNNTVTTFIRGLRGTEHNTGLHQVGDLFIVLNDPDIAFVPVPESSIGSTLTYRGVSRGNDIDAEFDVTIPYLGENMTPHSPADITATMNGADIVFVLTRRDRMGLHWTDYDGIPMSEEIEAFELDIYDEAGEEILRTLESDSTVFVYAEADIVEDFGAPTTEAIVAGYQLSAIESIGRGHGYGPVLVVAQDTQVSSTRWRLLINDSAGYPTQISFTELRLYDPHGTLIDLSGATATASDFIDGTYAPAKAIDGSTSTRWGVNSPSYPEWVEVELLTPAIVSYIEITGVSGTNNNEPGDFEVQYYDGAAHVTLASFPDEEDWGSLEIRRFDIQ